MIENRRPNICDAAYQINHGHKQEGTLNCLKLTISYDGTAGHCTKIGHDLGYRDRVGREVVLVFQHRGIQILRTMRLLLCQPGITVNQDALTMKLKPAIRRTRYINSSQWRLSATLPSAMNVPATFPLTARTASRS